MIVVSLIAMLSLTTMAFVRNARVSHITKGDPVTAGKAQYEETPEDVPVDKVIIRVVGCDSDQETGVVITEPESGAMTKVITLEDTGNESACTVKRIFHKARINEVLISYLMTGYEIESTEEGPRGDERGVRKIYSLRRI